MFEFKTHHDEAPPRQGGDAPWKMKCTPSLSFAMRRSPGLPEKEKTVSPPGTSLMLTRSWNERSSFLEIISAGSPPSSSRLRFSDFSDSVRAVTMIILSVSCVIASLGMPCRMLTLSEPPLRSGKTFAGGSTSVSSDGTAVRRPPRMGF